MTVTSSFSNRSEASEVEVRVYHCELICRVGVRAVRAIEVWILRACEPAVQIVWTGLHLHPCIVHDLSDCPCRDRAVLSNFLLPIVEERVVQWREALRSIRRHEENLFDRLGAAVTERL